ncbi:MAG: hypothetical protein U0798_05125 [Gemmataceae bacterium]
MTHRSEELSKRGKGLGVALLLIPGLTMGIAAIAVASASFAIGAMVVGIMGIYFSRSHPAWRPPHSIPVIAIYVVAACWLWGDPKNSAEPLVRFSRGGLAVIGVGIFFISELFRTGAEPRRRAAGICRRLLNRPNWPITLIECRLIPEVQELRHAVRRDMSPVVRLMADPRPEVRAAGFSALEGRKHWTAKEARLVLGAARQTVEPEVRAIAAYSLGGVCQVEVVQEVAGFLRDPAAEVRSAAAAGLLQDGGSRWPQIRDFVKAAFGDPRYVSDGGLPGVTGLLPVLATVDLVAWSTEGGLIAERSCRTLLEHHHYHLKSANRVTYAAELGRQLFDQKLSTDLRVGLSRLLKKHDFLDRTILDRMTNSEQPGPIRLMAAEILIADDVNNSDGLDVLRGLGRQQNREISLAIARILQTYLGMDMGLPSARVAPHSKQAGEIVRRVMMWASGKERDPVLSRSEQPTPTAMFQGMDAPVPQARLRGRQVHDDELDFNAGPVTGPQSIIQ